MRACEAETVDPDEVAADVDDLQFELVIANMAPTWAEGSAPSRCREPDSIAAWGIAPYVGSPTDKESGDRHERWLCSELIEFSEPRLISFEVYANR
jgi:hypothetical protein